jgi:glyoxylase-like metal-dependent hydrolase (beta-lactamase superfamily II)
MADELADGVHAFPQTISRDGQEATFTPAAVETDRGLVLLDVGFPHAVDQLEDHLADAGHGLEDVWAVLLTHQDGDHAAGLSAVVERADPLVFAHPEAAPYVDGRLDPIKSDEDSDRYPPVPVDVEVADGTAFRTAAGRMEVIHTPGHAPGHVSLYLPEARLLLAGDALTAPEGALSGPSEEFTPDMDEAVESVGRLADEDVERTLCYHGGLVDQGTGAIARLWTELAE